MSAITVSRLVPVLLLSGALLGCSAAPPPPDPRTPNEIATPSLEEWRAVAHGLAADLAPDVAARSILGPASLAPVEGSAPAYFRDLLLADLIDEGVVIIEADTAASLRIACHATPIDVLPNPRGPMVAAAANPGEIFVLCLLAHDGAYLAMEERSLSVPPRPEAPARGIIIGVTG